VLLGFWVLAAGCGRCSPPESVGFDGGAALPASTHGSSPDADLDGGQDEDGGIPASELGWIHPLNGRLFQGAGKEDERNRYPFAVMVKTRAPMAAGVNGECTGVLIRPDLVLTAGHCVCIRRKDTAAEAKGRMIIDGSACSGTAVVITVSYTKEGAGGSVLTTRSRVYRGETQPHPKLRILMDSQGNVLSSEADLALIVLNKRVEEAQAVAVADAEPRNGEMVVIASYGYDEIIGGMDAKRRFKAYKVMDAALEGGRSVFEQPQRALYKGDSGGPVLLLREGKTLFVGISTAALGEEATFVGLSPYRDWLAVERVSP